MRTGIQTLARALYPPECMLCRTALAEEDGLCGSCWRDCAFIDGEVCTACGVPMQGEVETGDLCDACQETVRPWAAGRAALLYKGNGRDIVIALKYKDAHEFSGILGKWMARTAQPLMTPEILIAPVPLHWTRLIKRRYNQSALLAEALADQTGHDYRHDLLRRLQATPRLDRMSHDDRFKAVKGVFLVNPARRRLLLNRPVLLVDDVMTSGATLAGCARACLAAGAASVNVVTLARVAKDA